VSARVSRSAVSAISVIAVCVAVCTPHWAPAHAHEQVSGAPLVHAHQQESHSHDADPNTLDHGKARDLVTVTTAFKVERAVELFPLMASAGILVPEDPTPQSLSAADDAPLIHGPPLRVPSLRAPPA